VLLAEHRANTSAYWNYDWVKMRTTIEVGAVKNLRIFTPLENGDQLELTDCPTGLDLILALLPDARSAEPKALVIEATDKDQRVVRIVVPADDSELAKVSISDV
jgi:hypothetical protein